MSPVRFSRGAVALFALLVCPSAAHADWLLIPFFGGAFNASTTIVDLQAGSNPAVPVIGASGTWLSDGLVGVEADFTRAPGFFDRDEDLLLSSSVTAVSGSVIVAVPLSITRESLRPYLVGGVGVVRAALEDQLDFVAQSHNEPALSVGGGALGFLSPRLGLRFDLRHVRSLRRADTLAGDRMAKLSFWRGTVGVVFRY